MKIKKFVEWLDENHNDIIDRRKPYYHQNDSSPEDDDYVPQDDDFFDGDDEEDPELAYKDLVSKIGVADGRARQTNLPSGMQDVGANGQINTRVSNMSSNEKRLQTYADLMDRESRGELSPSERILLNLMHARYGQQNRVQNAKPEMDRWQAKYSQF